ncbi:unnamed protein product [Scytosiphon promiscuus]
MCLVQPDRLINGVPHVVLLLIACMNIHIHVLQAAGLQFWPLNPTIKGGGRFIIYAIASVDYYRRSW